MLTNSKLVISLKTEDTKRKVFQSIAKILVEQKLITNEKELVQSFEKREEEFSTGMSDGIAIPHAQITGIEKPIVVIARLSKVEWESLDGQPTETAVAIVVPEGKGGDHLAILAALSRRMVDPEFLNVLKKGTKEEVVELVNSVTVDDQPKHKHENKENTGDKKYVVGITACPTGIAHTFMAQQKIIDACEFFGYDYKIETQGSEGIKDKLTLKDISSSDAIIISTGKELEEMERFNGYEGKIYHSELQNTIKNNKDVVEKALEHAKGFIPSSNGVSNTEVNFTTQRKSKFEIGMGHMMSGISAFIPLIITAGLLMAIGNIGALYWVMTDSAHTSISSADWINGTLDSNVWIHLMWWINQTGSIVMKFMFPFFTMYLAMSIGGRVVMIPAFIGGVMAAGLETYFFTETFFESSQLISWAYPNGFIASSFFGAIIIGFFVGTFGKFLNNKIQVSPNMMTFKTLLAIPLILTLSTFFLMAFVINPVFGMVNYGISEAFKAAGESGRYIYHLSIAAGMAFDLGGPVNKAALSVAYGFLPEAEAAIALINEQIAIDPTWVNTAEYTECVNLIKTFNVTGKNVGQVIPPIGLGLAAVFGNRLTGRHLFDNDDMQLGGQSMFLGTIGISEGAIPFLLKYPLYVLIADMVGAMVGAAVAVSFGTIQTLAIPAIWGWFLAGSTTIGISGIAPYGVQIIGYFAGVISGAVVTATIIISLMLLQDIRTDKENKVYSKQERSLLVGEELVEANEQTKQSVDIIVNYFNEEKELLNNVSSGSFEKLSNDEINEINISFSREKVKLAKEKCNLAKINFYIQRDKGKVRQLNTQLNSFKEDLEYKLSQTKDQEKILIINDKFKLKENKIKEQISNLELKIKDSEQSLHNEQAKVATYIDKQLDMLERVI